MCQYKWYDWCYFRDQTAAYPFPKEVLGRVLGPAFGEGNEMYQRILKANGRVVPRRSLRPLTTAEIHSPIEIKKRQVFDKLIERRWGTSINPPTKPEREIDKEFDPYEDDDEPAKLVPEIEDVIDHDGKLLDQQPAYDTIINAEVQMQLGNKLVTGKVVRRTLGPNGKTMGTWHENPIMNSVIYEVEFPDGQVKEYGANIIAENIFSQVDSDGHSMRLFDAIVDYERDDNIAVSMEDRHIYTKSGQKRLRKSTKGWRLLVHWRDGSESWVKLSEMKESHPVETAEFAKARGIYCEPAFAWWVPYTLRKRDVILAAVKSRIRKKTHKYGIEIPTSIEHAIELDRKIGNSLWQDALKKKKCTILGSPLSCWKMDKRPHQDGTKSQDTWSGTLRWTSPGRQGGSLMVTKQRILRIQRTLVLCHVKV